MQKDTYWTRVCPLCRRIHTAKTQSQHYSFTHMAKHGTSMKTCNIVGICVPMLQVFQMVHFDLCHAGDRVVAIKYMVAKSLFSVCRNLGNNQLQSVTTRAFAELPNIRTL